MDGTLLSTTGKITRAELAGIPAPPPTRTHQPIPHHEVVASLVEVLSFRHIGVVRDEYAVSKDGMKMFGVLDLELLITGCRFSIGIRNANDKSMRLGLTVGYRVLVCDNMAFHGDFTPLLAKHSKNFSLPDSLSIGVDRMQRAFEPMRQEILGWRETHLSDDVARLLIYEAFIEGKLAGPKRLASSVHEHYFTPQHEEFQPRTMWSLSNAFTSSFKKLEAVPQFRMTAKLGRFLPRLTRVQQVP